MFVHVKKKFLDGSSSPLHYNKKLVEFSFYVVLCLSFLFRVCDNVVAKSVQISLENMN